MKALALALIFSAAVPAMASTLTYKLDLSQTPDIDVETATDLCGLPETITIDSKEDLATAVINKTQSISPAKLTIQKIEASKGGISGGDLKEPYMGDYRRRVSIVTNSVPNTMYNFGIVSRVEIVTYGSPAAPKAFTLATELLNYRDSAEVAEGNVCPNVSYKLKK